MYEITPVTLLMGKSDDEVVETASGLSLVSQARLGVLVSICRDVPELKLFSHVLAGILEREFLNEHDGNPSVEAITAFKESIHNIAPSRVPLARRKIGSLVYDVNAQLLIRAGITPKAFAAYEEKPWEDFCQETGLEIPALFIPIIRNETDIKAWMT